ncbi:MAG: chemotaxis-specific protein-glutamate methyltransferase CheB [Lachnospiraceae bacterium]|nr:chemotaxis-specific protein-glutamate methyltransferase CheB [Lachnospiraceae bacterium]
MALAKKKILVVDDSALMRRVLCDIINSDEMFEVADRAINGLEAFDLITRNTYDAVVLDVNMPRMNGLQLLTELRKHKVRVRVMMASTDTMEGAKTTLDALELGALDFIHKPDSANSCREGTFQHDFLRTLRGVVNSRLPEIVQPEKLRKEREENKQFINILRKSPAKIAGTKIVALASSTGGPKALQSVIPRLPANLDAPVLVVQHMPKGFTASLADRLNALSEVNVCEAAEGQKIEKGTVYIAKGGAHMNLVTGPGGAYTIHYTDEPIREGVKPCANYMYESLIPSKFDKIVCVVLTGMGADGTEGIKNLKAKRKAYVISQDEATSTIYGMPKSVAVAGLTDQVAPLDNVASEVVLQVGLSN